MRFLNRYQGEAYALLRIVSGFMFSCHGMQKIMGLFGGMTPSPAMGSQLWFAGIIELVGGLLILLGVGARIAAFIASGEMAVAYFQVHWQGAFSEQFFPLVNHGELPLLYCFVFLYIATHGSGKWALLMD